MSPQILQFLKEIEVPVDSVLTVLDEFRKADKYGPALMTVLNQIMAAIGLQTRPTWIGNWPRPSRISTTCEGDGPVSECGGQHAVARDRAGEDE